MQWMVALRAEGERCLVFSSGGRTVSRNRSGNVVHRGFASLLPSGSYVQSTTKSTVTILDCVWIPRIATYYVMDCLLWTDQPIGLSEAAFRMWFVRSKLAECGPIDVVSKQNKFRFVAMEPLDVTVQNLQFLYRGGHLLNAPGRCNDDEVMVPEEEESDGNGHGNGQSPIRKMNGNGHSKWVRMQPDGLIFYHKHGCYVERVSCPLVLLWKDRALSRWFIDSSNRQHEDKALQFVTLQLRRNGTVTAHEEEVVLGAVSREEIERRQFVPDQLLRFSITAAVATEWKVENLQYVKRGGKSKMMADSWTKIVFQHQAKNGGGVTFESLVGAVTESIEADDDGDDIEDELRIATLGMEKLTVH